MLDVIITSTCRKTIKLTLRSFLKNVFYSGRFRFIVNIDVKYPKYLAGIKTFLKNMDIKDKDITINMLPKPWPMGLTEATNHLYGKIESKYYFNLQDDWIFLKKINLDPLIDLMENKEDVDNLRFNKERIREYAWLYHYSDKDLPLYRKPKISMNINGINLVKTLVWSFNPSIARTSTMKKMLPVPNDTRAETYFCCKYDEIFFTRGAYILGKIGEGHVCKDIGRPHPIIRRMKSFLKNPSYYFKKYLIS